LLVKGAFFYDPCVKVPLILRQPGVVPAGVRTKALVQPHDLAATILAAAGKDSTEIQKLMPKSMDIRIALEQGHETAVCSYRETGIDRRGRYFEPRIDATMITDGHGKLIVYNPEPGLDAEPQGQYFDLDENPEETHDLWLLENVRKSQLAEALATWLVEEEHTKHYQVASVEPQMTQMVDNRVATSSVR
jgi:arylsulfatase A-like enzyme